MRENAAKAKWRRGEVTYGAWLSIPSAFSAEMVAHAGFDWVCIDMQHGLIDYQVAVTMLLALSPATARRSCACPGTSRASSARCSTPAPTASSSRW